MRKVYLDRLRYGTVMLVIFYHVLFVYNSLMEFGVTVRLAEKQPWDVLLTIVYPWFMVLLFVIAGMSLRYALQKTDAKTLFRRRTVKLLVPSTIGLFVFYWIVGYMNLSISGVLSQMPSFLVYPISAISGTGPLWFAQLLWVLTAVALLVRRIDRSEKLTALGAKVGVVGAILFALPVWGASYLLNTPVVTVYRFGIYGFTFAVGYCVLSHDALQEKLAAAWKPLAAAAVAFGIAYTVYNYGVNYAVDAVLTQPLTNAYAWLAVLALLGFGKAKLDRPTRFTPYLKRVSFGWYTLHDTVIIAVSMLLAGSGLPVAAVYAITFVAAFAVTALLTEIFMRLPVLRWCVLGISKKSK